MRKELIEPNRARYVKLCETKKNDVTSTISSSARNVGELLSNIYKKTEELNEVSLKLSILSSSKVDRFEKMYDSLVSYNKVSKVFCDEAGTIVVITKPLFSGRNFLGSLRIETDLKSLNVYNVTQAVEHETWGTLHIPQMILGQVVFGSATVAVTQLLVEKDVYGLVRFIISFVESGKVDGEPCGSVAWWPDRRESPQAYRRRIEKLGLKARGPEDV